MTEYSKKISFWSLLESKKVVIPIIQRDYAQGRKGKEFLRERFLSQLFDAFQEDAKPLVLDFVYGSVEEDTLYPLDGQQRLTTLWLLHWYLALCAGTLGKDKEILQRFSYETRVSSRTFCQRLCDINEEYKPKNHSIRSFIRNQRWYYSIYDQDPTIQSMLRMLEGTDIKDSNEIDIIDGIEEYYFKWIKDKALELFEHDQDPIIQSILRMLKDTTDIKDSNEKDIEEYYFKWMKDKALELLGRLKDEENAPVKFYLLNMEDKNMPLTDDLYIKMNARGKILTDFENFKADLLKYKEKQSDREYLIPENDRFSVLMDTNWTDIFWHFRSTENHIDEIYMSFLNRFFLNWRIANTISKPEEIITEDLYKMLSIADKKGDKVDCQYKSMTVYKPILNKECIASLTACLNSLYKLYKDKDKRTIDELFRPYWKSDEDKTGNEPFYFVPHYKIKNIPITLNFQQQIAFQAICSYLTTCKDVNIDKLKDWMHFVWNIVENSYIDKEQSISAIRFFGKGINELPKLGEEGMPVNASEDIITYLAGVDESQIKETFGRRQLLEEIAKAKQIKKDLDWKEKICTAETFAFFKGAIAFLFNNEEGKIDWNYFDEKMETAKLLFDKEGVQIEKRVEALHTLYSYCDNWESQFWWNAKIFSCTAKTWKENILTKVNSYNTYIYAKPIHHLLMGDTPSNEIKSDKIRLLANESFVRFLVSENTNNWNLYIRHPHDALYYCGYKYGVMLNYPMRDTYLNRLLDAGIIELTDSNKRIADTGLFWGNLNINFIYHVNGKELYLQWYKQNNNKECDIYLMTQEWDYKRRPIVLENEQSDKKRYYCFNIAEPSEGTSYIESFCQQVETEFAEFILRRTYNE